MVRAVEALECSSIDTEAFTLVVNSFKQLPTPSVEQRFGRACAAVVRRPLSLEPLPQQWQHLEVFDKQLNRYGLVHERGALQPLWRAGRPERLALWVGSSPRRVLMFAMSCGNLTNKRDAQVLLAWLLGLNCETEQLTPRQSLPMADRS